jgi:hypothetical protein
MGGGTSVQHGQRICSEITGEELDGKELKKGSKISEEEEGGGWGEKVLAPEWC